MDEVKKRRGMTQTSDKSYYNTLHFILAKEKQNFGDEEL